MSTPEVGDALPGAVRALRLALTAGPGTWGEHLVVLLEAAGGLDEGNAARRHLERAGPPSPPPSDPGAPAVLAAALRLHEAAEQDLRAALERSGLSSHGSLSPGRRQRAEFAEQTLTERGRAVRAVLARLGEDAAAPG
jgi:hypothetical protein